MTNVRKEVAQFLKTRWSVLKDILFCVEAAVATLRANFEIIGLLHLFTLNLFNHKTSVFCQVIYLSYFAIVFYWTDKSSGDICHKMGSVQLGRFTKLTDLNRDSLNLNTKSFGFLRRLIYVHFFPQ